MAKLKKEKLFFQKSCILGNGKWCIIDDPLSCDARRKGGKELIMGASLHARI